MSSAAFIFLVLHLLDLLLLTLVARAFPRQVLKFQDGADFLPCYRMIIAAAFALNVAHPGPVFGGQVKKMTGFADSEAEAVHAETK